MSYFLQISGIAGESMDDQHANWIDISSTSVGVATMQQQTFHFSTSNVSLASPALLLGAASGQHFSNAVVGVRRGPARDPDFLRYVMTDVVVVTDGVGGSSGGSPNEQFSLSYSTLQIEYRQQRPDGTYGPPVISCWNFVVGAPCDG